MLKLIPPVNGPITQEFGENAIDYSRWGYPGHNGRDYGVALNTPVVAAADGRVDKIAWEAGGYGNYIILDHGGGFKTYYAHLRSTPAAMVGEVVDAGEVIGYSGNSGATTGPHLHFGLKGPGGDPRYKGYLDPAPYFVAQEQPSAPATAPIIPGSAVLRFPDGIDLRVVSDELNVRVGPGIGHLPIETLEMGDEIKAIRLHITGGWAELEGGRFCAIALGGYVYLTTVPAAE